MNMVTINCYRPGHKYMCGQPLMEYYKTYHMPFSRFYKLTNGFDRKIMKAYHCEAIYSDGDRVYTRHDYP